MIYYESRAEIGSGIEYGSPQRKPFIKGSTQQHWSQRPILKFQIDYENHNSKWNNKTNSGGAIPVFQALDTAVYRTVKQFIDLD